MILVDMSDMLVAALQHRLMKAKKEALRGGHEMVEFYIPSRQYAHCSELSTKHLQADTIKGRIEADPVS
jgi:hypothetical protein